MAKSEYICKSCKEVRKAGFFLGGNRYKCPTHGFICDKCVDAGFFSAKCKVCDSKTVKYSWDSQKSRWINS